MTSIIPHLVTLYLLGGIIRVVDCLLIQQLCTNNSFSFTTYDILLILVRIVSFKLLSGITRQLRLDLGSMIVWYWLLQKDHKVLSFLHLFERQVPPSRAPVGDFAWSGRQSSYQSVHSISSCLLHTTQHINKDARAWCDYI